MPDNGFIPDSDFVPDEAQQGVSQPVAAPNVPDREPATASPEVPSFIPDSEFVSDEDKYGTLGQQLITGAEGAASAATFGLSTGLEKALGVPEEDIRARRQENPLSHAVGQGAGLAATALIPGLGELSASKVLTGAGQAAAKFGPLGEGLAATMGREGLKAAAETALFQAGDEVSKMISEDPGQSFETAATSIGLAGLLGGGIGAAIGSVSPLWKAANGSKLGQELENFKGRVKEFLENPEPVQAVSDELANHYTNIKSMADEVYGTTGLKAQAIEKLLPDPTPKVADAIAAQTNELTSKLGSALEKLEGDAFAPKLQKAIEEYSLSMAENPTVRGIFSATQRLKQQMQEWGKFNKDLVPLAERDFREVAKTLGYELRNSLENESVWGGAALVQKDINKAFTEFLPALKDFEKKFTVEKAGEKIIDPAKVNTYINQIGKPNAEIKQDMMRSFLEASSKYQKVIDKVQNSIGGENLFQPSSLTATMQTLQELTPGAKLADALIRKGALEKLTASGAGASVGAGLGHLAGAGGVLGAVIGEHALSPFFKSILPSIIKPLLKASASAEGFKVATDYSMDVVKGIYLTTKAAEGIFDSKKEILPLRLVASDKDIKKLDEEVKNLSKDPSKMFDMGGAMGHYLPGHAMSLGQTLGTAISYLNSQRPQMTKLGPLDPELPPTKAQEMAYERTLRIAQQPLTIMQHIKEGTLQSKDLMDLNALYPGLYKGLREKVYAAMLDHVSKEGKIPYKSRLGLSLFLGQPLDASLTPEAIMAAQATFQMPGSQGAQQVPQKPMKKKASALDDVSKMVETPAQARETAKQ